MSAPLVAEIFFKPARKLKKNISVNFKARGGVNIISPFATDL